MSRLEEIERNVVAIYEKPLNHVGYEISKVDYEWLIRQAELNEITDKELVPKLMKLNELLVAKNVGNYGENNIDNAMDYIEELEKQLNGTEHKYGYKQMYGICNQDYATLNSEKNRYKQVLEFYADSPKYYEMNDPSGVLTVIEEDGGEKARQVLKEVNNA